MVGRWVGVSVLAALSLLAAGCGTTVPQASELGATQSASGNGGLGAGPGAPSPGSARGQLTPGEPETMTPATGRELPDHPAGPTVVSVTSPGSSAVSNGSAPGPGPAPGTSGRGYDAK